ncbi:MAG: pyridoxal-dependent decarboxylase [Planctomycetaceae bacterium]
MNSEIPAFIRAAYSADVFHDASMIWQQKLAEHLRSVMASDRPVMKWQEPTTALLQAGRSLLAENSESTRTCKDDLTTEALLQRFGDVMDQILSSGHNLHHPHYIGHQVPASVPLAGLFDAIASVTNQVTGVFEIGPWATAVELSLIRMLGEKIGWRSDECSGVLTHGGSLANLTALLTARNIAIPGCWESGVPQDAVLVAQSDAHYSVTRAAGILGLGSQQVVRVDLDERRRMRPDCLDSVLVREKERGRRIIAVCACACATPIGAFDPLDEIADVCERHQVWLHVDAAHGGSLMMSDIHRHKLAGIHRADSVVWDAHKMLFVPALCAAVLFRNRDVRYETFRQIAPYLFDTSSSQMADFDTGMRTLECTKRANGFGLWGLWTMLGDQVFESLVDQTIGIAGQLAELLRAAPDFELLNDPECNIVVFRHLPPFLNTAPAEEQDRFQNTIRSELMKSGRFYIVQTQLDGRVVLRAVIMNPMTTHVDLVELLNELRQCSANHLRERAR